jgi:hypothetical protein
MTVTAFGFSGPTWVLSPGNGSATTFNFPFLITTSTDLVVGFVVNGVYTKQPTGYSVPASSIANSGGGQVVFAVPPPSGTFIDIRSAIPETQPTNFSNLGAYYPENTTNALDRAVRNIADLYRLTYQFGIHGPDQESTPWPALPSASGRAGGLLVFDQSGLPAIGVLTSTPLTQSVFNGFLVANQVFPFPITGNEQLAGVTPTSFMYPEGNILRYGGDPTGNSSSHAAIQALVAVMCAGSASNGVGNHVRGYFPHGTYLNDSDSPFTNPLGATGFVQRGLTFWGDGKMSSLIYNNTGGSRTQWLINGPVGEQQYIALKFQDMGFIGDSAGAQLGLANGFNLYQSQNVSFDNCWFYNLGTAYQDSGTANGDGTKYYNCTFNQIYTRVAAFNNPQYLNVDYVSCAFEQCYGDIFYVAPQIGGAGGGGALRVIGSSLIMNNGPIPTYLLNIAANANLGNNNNKYDFIGMQVSGMGTTCALVNCQFTGGQAPHINFDLCNVAVSGTARLQVNIAQAKVVFHRCVLTNNSGDTYQVVGPTAGGGDQYGIPGSIEFIRSEVPENLWSYCTVASDAGDGLPWGYISAEQCYWSNYDASVSRVEHYAMDFELNWQNSGRASMGPRLKSINGKDSNRQWTDATGNFNWTVNLPVGAIPVSIQVFRPATATTSSFTLNVGTQANATAYGSSGLSNTNLSQSIVWDQSTTPANLIAVTSANNQVVLTASGASGQTAVGTGGLFIVKYY